MNEPSIILFDGVCNLCNGFVNFVIDRDPEGKFKFGALQSEEGQKLVHQYHLQDVPLESVILIENGIAYRESSAALRIAKGMKGGWKLFYAFLIVPPFIRNAVYRFIARNRYKWFGKQDTCRIPEPGIMKRFI